MDKKQAIHTLSALAQDSRLDAFRQLIREQPDGLPAGELAQRLGIPHNTMSAHLKILTQAGLIDHRRQGRLVIYQVDMTTVRELLLFLLADCCQGHPERCEPLLEAVLGDTVASCCK